MLPSPVKNNPTRSQNHQKPSLTHGSGLWIFFVHQTSSNSNQFVALVALLTNSPGTNRSAPLVTHAARWQSNGYFTRSLCSQGQAAEKGNSVGDGHVHLATFFGGICMLLSILPPHCRSTTRPSETENRPLGVPFLRSGVEFRRLDNTGCRINKPEIQLQKRSRHTGYL